MKINRWRWIFGLFFFLNLAAARSALMAPSEPDEPERGFISCLASSPHVCPQVARAARSAVLLLPPPNASRGAHCRPPAALRLKPCTVILIVSFCGDENEGLFKGSSTPEGSLHREENRISHTLLSIYKGDRKHGHISAFRVNSCRDVITLQRNNGGVKNVNLSRIRTCRLQMRFRPSNHQLSKSLNIAGC